MPCAPSNSEDDSSRMELDAQQDTVAQAIRKLFRAGAPKLEMGPNHISSDSTRQPGLYDLHLTNDLILEKVVYCPSLVDDLMVIANDALLSALAAGKLPSLDNKDGEYLDPKTINGMAEEYKIVNNEGVRSAYEHVIAPICCAVAETLETRQSHWKSTYLQWTREIAGQKEAMADGYFRFKLDADPDDAPLLLRAVERDFPTLFVWECKSMLAGDRQTMTAIVQQACNGGNFEWERCCGSPMTCQINHPTNANDEPVTGSRIGYDARTPICPSIRVAPHPEPGPPSQPLSVTNIH